MSTAPAHDRNPGAAREPDLTYLVAGMTCEHCRAAVTQEVGRVPGVAAVDVDLASKVVAVHGAGVDGAAVVAAIDEAGYDAVAA
jgi:copper chaperone CopZ